MMYSFLSNLPKGLFGLNQPLEGMLPRTSDGAIDAAVLRTMMEENERKRSRGGEFLWSFSGTSTSSGCSRTPTLISTRTRHRQNHDFDNSSDHDETLRPAKRFRGEHNTICLHKPLFSTDDIEQKKADIKPGKYNKKKSPLEQLPEDVMAHCLSFLGSTEDRFALQCTSKQFQRITNTDEMMIGIEVGGDRNTGKNGIIREDDTPETASDKLAPFALAGNLEALYMLGIIKSYCYQDVENGISLLKMASAQGYVRASYALGLVLRDSQPEEASKYMKLAADAKYLPALQELLPAREMKAKYGEPNADQLRRHLDHLCLNRLLSRHYVRSSELRVKNTSHCWNPLCGRWAFKGTVNASHVPARPLRRPFGFMFYRQAVTPSSGTNPPIATEEGAQGSHVSNTQERPSTIKSRNVEDASSLDVRVSRMKMCSRCCRAKYCSKLCQVYDWRSGRHKMECQFL